jgi:hypothetical protein
MFKSSEIFSCAFLLPHLRFTIETTSNPRRIIKAERERKREREREEDEKCNEFVEDDKININNLEIRPVPLHPIRRSRRQEASGEMRATRNKSFGILPFPPPFASCLSKCFSGFNEIHAHTISMNICYNMLLRFCCLFSSLLSLFTLPLYLK